MKGLHTFAFILLIIGGLNWLLTGLFSSWDLVAYLGSSIATVVYILVGLAAIVEIINHKSLCKKCDKGGMTMPSGN